MIKERVLLIIPAYNEEESIQRVIDELISDYPQYEYVIINDGSKDNTAKICKENRYNLIDLPVNLGLAGAFQAGMKYAYECNYSAVMQYDGDGQHDAQYIGQLYRAMKEENVDIVIGSRFINRKKSGGMRMWGSRLIEWVLKITTGKRIKDPTSGMRMYNNTMVERFAKNINYGPEPDTLAYLLRCGINVKEVQVEMNERTSGESYLNIIRSIKYMIHMIMSIIVMQFARKKEK